MSSLVEFLLERIAEDEAVIEKHASLGPHDDDPPWHDGLGLSAAEIAEAEAVSAEVPPPWGDVFTVERMRAECKVKRDQIEHLIRFMEGDYAPWSETQLRIMAAVYADHPDHRGEEWAP